MLVRKYSVNETQLELIKSELQYFSDLLEYGFDSEDEEVIKHHKIQAKRWIAFFEALTREGTIENE